MIQAIRKGYYFNIGTGATQRSMVLVEDVAGFIDQVYTLGGIYHLTDGEHPSFNALSLSISKQMNKRSLLSLPYRLIRLLALLGDFLGGRFPMTSNKLNKMTKTLTFSDQKARNKVGWNPKPVVDHLII